MHHFIKVCTATPQLFLADCNKNAEMIIYCLKEAAKNKATLIVFPELCLTGHSCEDLFFQSTLIDAAEKATKMILDATKDLNLLAIIGAPVKNGDQLYNCALVIFKGQILGIVPKTYLPNYGEFYEKRWFALGAAMINDTITYAGMKVPMSVHLLFKDTAIPELVIGIDVCEDLWVTIPPSRIHALAGATVIANLSASNETTGKSDYRKQLISQHSGTTATAYLYTSSSVGESTMDLVYSGQQLIYENGYLLAESALFSMENLLTYANIDLERLIKERLRRNNFLPDYLSEIVAKEKIIPFEMTQQTFELTRKINPHPFVPSDEDIRMKRCRAVFDIQSYGLARRMQYAKADYLILGMSGGLDSTLALLVCLKAVKHLGLPPTAVMGVTMPGFGTTSRTYQNALELMRLAGITAKEISIVDATTQHLKDIEHPLDLRDTTYENAQARERTQILMDLSNQWNGLVIGTGDLSEMALGWATFNGDHMAMYAVNSAVPKTLVHYLIDYVAHYESEPMLQELLFDILETPISPELLPPDPNGNIKQKTENIVGPYELHDFFIYEVLRFGYAPSKVFFLAKHAFKGKYTDEEILKWLNNFYERFFKHQFKRSCFPDGPKVGSICLSPRGDLRMPSDACAQLWLKEMAHLMAHHE